MDNDSEIGADGADNIDGDNGGAIFTEPVAEQIWQTRYRLSGHGGVPEPSVQASWARVALALSASEPHHRDLWYERFVSALSHFRFLPGGRILAGAGAHRRVTLCNCFVMGPIDDSISAIFSALGESMVTMQEGGGIGLDFSTLRPAGMAAVDSGNVASGPVSFMRLWDAACATLLSTGPRRGAMMATLRCDHPDIETFIEAKNGDPRDPGLAAPLRHFNLSVLVTDAFMQAVAADAPWPLMFPLAGRTPPAGGELCDRLWSGAEAAEPCEVLRTVGARALWERLLRAAFACGDPGVIFIDRVQRANNLWYAERISATNPCGEVPLPPHGACTLGSINLARFVHEPFGAHPQLDLQAIASSAALAVRMLDNVLDISHFPLAAQARVARASRRVGLGITGLADAFAMLGVRYGSDASQEIADAVMRTISHAAYRSSIALAQERGAFPSYRPADYLAGEFIASLPAELRDAIRLTGIRNSHLTAIAPAGTISLLANNVSSGIEPVYAFETSRRINMPGGASATVPLHDYAWSLFRKLHGKQAPLPGYFVESGELDPLVQLTMQARLQEHVDQSISKTINLAPQATFDQCRALFTKAWQLGLKGCTMFRADPARASVLSPACRDAA